MSDKVNIVIPAVELNDELLKCLREINKINYTNFFTTIVLDYKSKQKLPKLKIADIVIMNSHPQSILGKISL